MLDKEKLIKEKEWIMELRILGFRMICPECGWLSTKSYPSVCMIHADTEMVALLELRQEDNLLQHMVTSKTLVTPSKSVLEVV